MKFVGDSFVSFHKARSTREKLQFLGAFLASAQYAQILHLSPLRALIISQRVAKEGEVGLAEKGWHGASNKADQGPREMKENTGGQADSGHYLLNQAASHLNRQHAVIGLQSRPFHLVAENWIFEASEIKARRV